MGPRTKGGTLLLSGTITNGITIKVHTINQHPTTPPATTINRGGTINRPHTTPPAITINRGGTNRMLPTINRGHIINQTPTTRATGDNGMIGAYMQTNFNQFSNRQPVFHATSENSSGNQD